jgi:MYXO-CTERM domain-containing protein
VREYSAAACGGNHTLSSSFALNSINEACTSSSGGAGSPVAGFGLGGLGAFIVEGVGLTGVVRADGPASVPCRGSAGRPVMV